MIYLDSFEIDSFEGTSMEASARYESLKESFTNDDVFDEIILIEQTILKTESLQHKEKK